LSTTYSKEFKVYAVGEYMTGKHPLQIFIEAGINVNILGREQPQKCLSRWQKIHDKYGIDGPLKEKRGVGNSGRPSTKELTIEEKTAKLEQENTILKEQVSF
jgi:transposase